MFRFKGIKQRKKEIIESWQSFKWNEYIKL